ncbi:hypothetical protein HYV88_02480 [Candidatus Woesearchaeota archaeon]|nr:hypothetical protein [Candidatus Woesearchaeota archaeon]
MIIIKQSFSTILRRAIIFSTLFSGIYFIIISLSEPSITGSVIGYESSKLHILLGLILFLISVSLSYFFEK